MAVLDNCQSEIDQYGQYELLVGVASQSGNRYETWASLQQADSRWLMGVFPYELKNQFESRLHSRHKPLISFPEVAWFEPETLLMIPRGESTLYEVHPTGIHPFELPALLPTFHKGTPPPPVFTSNFTKTAYLDTIRDLQAHIREGDFYEINLSQSFTADYTLSNPGDLYMRLTAVSPMPFAGMFKWQDQYLLCASPERFLQIKGDRIVSQPIKGTTATATDPEEDQQRVSALLHSEKERAENVMIVDLTRNDLYRSSQVNSVQVDHLFEVQSFAGLHHLVSTVSGKRRPDLNWQEILSNTFPAGSMTGAPKISTMEHIDHYEKAGRGIYAGSMGYLDPSGNLDLNVIIRSMIYDQQQRLLTYQVGGAITYDSIPEAEYEETLIKAAAIRKLF